MLPPGGDDRDRIFVSNPDGPTELPYGAAVNRPPVIRGLYLQIAKYSAYLVESSQVAPRTRPCLWLGWAGASSGCPGHGAAGGWGCGTTWDWTNREGENASGNRAPIADFRFNYSSSLLLIVVLLLGSRASSVRELSTPAVSSQVLPSLLGRKTSGKYAPNHAWPRSRAPPGAACWPAR